MSKWMPSKPPHYNMMNMNWQQNMNREVIDRSTFDSWYAEHIAPLFENAVEVFGESTFARNTWSITKTVHDTHRALVINLTPIKEESAEDILREIISTYESKDDSSLLSVAMIRAACDYSLIERAKAYLARKDGK